jgi:molybdopterin converting factor small subunit
MSISVVIPTPLRSFVGGHRQLTISATTVAAALDEVTARYPKLRTHIYAGDDLRAFVNVFVNDDNIRDIGGSAVAVAPGDTITIIPSIAGG